MPPARQPLGSGAGYEEFSLQTADERAAVHARAHAASGRSRRNNPAFGESKTASAFAALQVVRGRTTPVGDDDPELKGEGFAAFGDKLATDWAIQL